MPKLYHWYQNWPCPGITSFTWASKKETLEIFLHVAISGGPPQRVPKFYSPGGQNCPRCRGHKFYLENFRNHPVPSHKAIDCKILYVALSDGPLTRVPKL